MNKLALAGLVGLAASLSLKEATAEAGPLTPEQCADGAARFADLDGTNLPEWDELKRLIPDEWAVTSMEKFLEAVAWCESNAP